MTYWNHFCYLIDKKTGDISIHNEYNEAIKTIVKKCGLKHNKDVLKEENKKKIVKRFTVINGARIRTPVWLNKETTAA